MLVVVRAGVTRPAEELQLAGKGELAPLRGQQAFHFRHGNLGILLLNIAAVFTAK